MAMETEDRVTGEPCITIPCRRCGERGYIARFGHVLKGVCFDCSGGKRKILSAHKTERVLRSITIMVSGRRRFTPARTAA